VRFDTTGMVKDPERHEWITDPDPRVSSMAIPKKSVTKILEEIELEREEMAALDRVIQEQKEEIKRLKNYIVIQGTEMAVLEEDRNEAYRKLSAIEELLVNVKEST